MNGTFRFKQFAIQQDRCAMKVGTDSVLLGSWANAKPCAKILDIGTGTGILALMLAQRFPEATIDAIDIVAEAIRQARENFDTSPWSSRLNTHITAVQQFHPDHAYDLIVANPPYFNDALRPHQKDRADARHDARLPLSDLAESANRLLTEDGKFCLILPPERSHEFLPLMAETGLFCTTMLVVHPTPSKKPKRMLMNFSRNSGAKMTTSQLTVELQRHQYSPEFTDLAREFLLRL